MRLNRQKRGRGYGMATDELLVHAARNGDLNAYAALVERHQDKIYNLTAKMVENEEDARDLTQEVFLQLYQSLPSFRSESSFGTWAYRIAANKCLDFLRKKKTRGKQVVLSTDAGDTLSGDCREGPEEAAIRRDESRRLKAAIKTLPEVYRIVLVLHHYQQLPYKEIADVLSVPVKTVATRLYRAKLILKEMLAGGDASALQEGKGQPGQLHGQGI